MKEISSETFIDMQPALGIEPEQTFENTFYFKRELPENLKSLETIAWNYFWSWETAGAEIFRELEPALWEKCEQNPRLLLRKVKQFRLWQKSIDAEYVEKVSKFAEKQENYLRVEPMDSGRVILEKCVRSRGGLALSRGAHPAAFSGSV